MHVRRVCYVGIDLAVKKGRCSGVAIKYGEYCESLCAYSWSELLKLLSKFLSTCTECVVAIDAPLTLPRNGCAFRNVDRKLIARGYRLLPLSFKGMRLLTNKAMELKRILEGFGCVVLETHPRSALLSSRCGSIKELAKVMGLDRCVDAAEQLRVKDVLDAVVSLAVALCRDLNCVEVIEADDGAIALLKELCLNG